MQKFRATFTPRKRVYSNDTYNKLVDGKPRTVMVLEFVNEKDSFNLLFVDEDRTIGVASLDCFTDCKVWEDQVLVEQVLVEHKEDN